MSIRKVALGAFKAPFTYIRGYIWDAADQMVADNHVERDHTPALRVRGWGYLQKLPNGAEVQDEVGRQLAEALTVHWEIFNFLEAVTAGEVSFRKNSEGELMVRASAKISGVNTAYAVVISQKALASAQGSVVGLALMEVLKPLKEELDASKS